MYVFSSLSFPFKFPFIIKIFLLFPWEVANWEFCFFYSQSSLAVVDTNLEL